MKKKKTKKNGFTLVELLAVIVVVAVLGSIAVANFQPVIQKSKRSVFTTYEESMLTRAKVYFINHDDKIPAVGGTLKLGLNDLNIDPFKNPDNDNDKCLSSYVNVTRSEDVGSQMDITYKVCLICNNYKTTGC